MADSLSVLIVGWNILPQFISRVVPCYVELVFKCLFQVKMRILMGTYALSAGYYDAYYKRAQQVFLVLFFGFLCA